MTDDIQAVVQEIDDLHPEIRIIRIRPRDGTIFWQAGQFMEFAFSGFPSRPYSIANACHNPLIEFHIRNNNRGGASQYAVTCLKIGDSLTLRGPLGHVTLPPDDHHPLVLIAGGMGLSPMKAIAEEALHRNHPGPITLYWGGREVSDLYLADYFQALARNNPSFRFVPVIESRGDGLVGNAAAHDKADFSSSHIYLAGPPAMVTRTLPLLLEKGARHDFIHTDDLVVNSILPQRPGAKS